MDTNLNFDTVSERPWGSYFKLYQEKGVWVKRVAVDKGCRLSLQKHAHRSEKWIVVNGTGLVVLNGVEITVNTGSVVDVPSGAEHRIGNVGQDKLVFIEVACGDYLGEDDIVRIQDDFAREPEQKS
jgi:mannose-6-phosphate isomerase